MKKSILKTITLLTSFAIIACSQDKVMENTQTVNDSDAINKICITGKDFQIDDDTRSSVTIGESGVSFAWDEDDVVGIFPDKGDQVSFAMEEGTGTQTATFSGGGWALKSSAKYAAYYPHVYENRDMTAIPVSYVGQTQNGSGNTDHIGAYDFMAAGVSTPENGTVAFDMQHLGALVQFTITVLEPSTLTKVVLISSTEFTETGTIDLTADTPAITAVTQSNTFEIALNNVVTTEANENVIVYFMTAPIDLTDSEFTAKVHFADETIIEVEITGKNFQAGKAYRLSPNAKMVNDYIDEYGINHGNGVEIDGVIWAPVNCGYHETDYPLGKLYQWGRKYGQGRDGDSTFPAEDNLVSGPVSLQVGQAKENEEKFYLSNGAYDWLNVRKHKLWNSGTDGAAIKTEYDPCPDGWRVPDSEELRSLIEKRSSWTTNEEGQEGMYFYGKQSSYDSTKKIFFPGAGERSHLGTGQFTGKSGKYWTSSVLRDYSYYLNYMDGYVSVVAYGYRAEGKSVRCVQE